MDGLGQDELRHITVGDPDPTSHLGQKCGFEWADETSPTLILLWSCTRELGHQGQHLAGTGEWVAAVRGSEEHQPCLPQTGSLKHDTSVENLATKDR